MEHFQSHGYGGGTYTASSIGVGISAVSYGGISGRVVMVVLALLMILYMVVVVLQTVTTELILNSPYNRSSVHAGNLNLNMDLHCTVGTSSTDQYP